MYVGGILMERTVTVIEPKVKPKFLTDGTALMPGQKRVAAYCRVSTTKEEQVTSIDNQADEWQKRLSSDPRYILVEIYVDHGLSGTNAANRVQLNKMIDDAKAGKIDKIFTKSISRFARNVADSISIARELKEVGVEIYFDEEHLSSIDPHNDVMFTIGALMAQEESRHMSENIKWTFEKKMREGCVFLTDSKFLGYRIDPDNPKNLIIVPEEAEIVRLIYDLYLKGMGTNAICRKLEAEGYLTGAKKKKWYQSTIESIIKNEKYCGDLLLQKSYTPDFLTHKRVKNEGQVPKYFIEDNHEPIIDKETWNKAQILYQRNRDKFCGVNKNMKKYTHRYPYSGLLMCIHCGDSYKRRHWTQGYKTPRIVYQCSNYIEGNPNERCPAKPISEDIIAKTLCEVINKVYLKDSCIFKTVFNLIKKNLEINEVTTDITVIQNKQSDLEKEITAILSQKAVATTSEEQFILDKSYRAKLEEYKGLDNQIAEALDKQKEADYAKQRIETIKSILNTDSITPELITKQIIDAFIAKVIIIDRQHIVIVIRVTEGLGNDYIKEHRYEIIDNDPILTGQVHLDRRFKPEDLEYKVVLI